MSGSNFEDDLIEQLSEQVGDNGVVMRQKQELRTRNGSFQADQYVDILVDSRDDDWYVGFEAKHARADSNTPKFYFSAKYNEDQIRKQEDFEEKSGRRVFVAVRVKAHEGEDYDLLYPLQYFLDYLEAGESGVEWVQLVEDGVNIDDGIGQEALSEAEEVVAAELNAA
jgi:hypothetical protein